jgi:hypothetical protein
MHCHIAQPGKFAMICIFVESSNFIRSISELLERDLLFVEMSRSNNKNISSGTSFYMVEYGIKRFIE